MYIDSLGRSLANRHSFLAPAQNQEHRCWKCWTLLKKVWSISRWY